MNEELKKPSGFLWMDEWAELTADLTNEQIGILLRSAQNFHMGNPYDIGEDKELKMAFRFISNCIKQNDEKYGRACKLKAEARERQIRNRNKKNGINEDMPTNAEICQDMPTNADYQNTNTSTNQNTSTNTNQNQNQNENTTPYKKGECVTPAPARMGVEYFGTFHNVELLPQERRTLVEQYGEALVDETIDALSCKLMDGNAQSNYHYATLQTWLKHSHRQQVEDTSRVATFTPIQWDD